MNISIDARSDQSFQVNTDSNNSTLVLDNENPVIIDSIPSNQDYLDSLRKQTHKSVNRRCLWFNADNMKIGSLGPRN